MKQVVFDNLIAHYVAQRQQGVDFGQIRRELNENNVPQDIIDFLIKTIDNEELYQVEQKSNQQKGREYIMLALLLFITPLGILLYGFITKGGSIEVFLASGILGYSLGIPCFIFGIHTYRQKPTYFKGYPSIRKQALSGESKINYHSEGM